MAQGKAKDIEKILNMNHRLAFTHTLFEMQHKKLAEWYGYIKYNTNK